MKKKAKIDVEAHQHPEEGCPTSSKPSFVLRSLPKTLQTNISPYNPILPLPGLQKITKKAKIPMKKGQKSIFLL